MKTKTKDPLVQKVIDRIAKRSDKGIKKYVKEMRFHEGDGLTGKVWLKKV